MKRKDGGQNTFSTRDKQQLKTLYSAIAAEHAVSHISAPMTSGVTSLSAAPLTVFAWQTSTLYSSTSPGPRGGRAGGGGGDVRWNMALGSTHPPPTSHPLTLLTAPSCPSSLQPPPYLPTRCLHHYLLLLATLHLPIPSYSAPSYHRHACHYSPLHTMPHSLPGTFLPPLNLLWLPFGTLCTAPPPSLSPSGPHCPASCLSCQDGKVLTQPVLRHCHFAAASLLVRAAALTIYLHYHANDATHAAYSGSYKHTNNRTLLYLRALYQRGCDFETLLPGARQLLRAILLFNIFASTPEAPTAMYCIAAPVHLPSPIRPAHGKHHGACPLTTCLPLPTQPKNLLLNTCCIPAFHSTSYSSSPTSCTSIHVHTATTYADHASYCLGATTVACIAHLDMAAPFSSYSHGMTATFFLQARLLFPIPP